MAKITGSSACFLPQRGGSGAALMPFSTSSGADLEPQKSVSDAQLVHILLLSTAASYIW